MRKIERKKKSRYVRELYRYGLILLVLWLAGMGIFRIQRDQNIQQVMQQSLEDLRKQFRAAQSPFDKLGQNFYNDKNTLLSRMVAAAQKEQPRSEKWREKILDRFFREYKSAEQFGLTEFAVYTAQGRLLCSFAHKKEQEGGESSPPKSVQKVIETTRFFKGFEKRRAIDGFRYLYPLFYEGEFVGLYEWVWSFEALIRELRRIDPQPYLILSEKRNIHPENLPGFTPIPECNSYGSYRTLLSFNGNSFLPLLEEVARKVKLCNRLNMDRDQVALFDDKKYRHHLVELLLLPSLSDTDAIYGYLFSIKKEERIAEINHLFILELVVSAMVLLLIFMLLYHSSWESTFVRTIIDTQRDLVILTNNERLVDANHAFLDFFNVKDLDDFVEKYGCICTKFLPREGSLHRHSTQGESWLQYLKKYPKQTRVTLYDERRKEDRIFIVALNPFDDAGLYVISFRDITELEQEKHHFKLASMLDHLTQIYNKRTFETYLMDRLQSLRKSQHDEVALVMFDIDHFKQINDRYGHLKGDEVLKKLTKLVQDHIRKEDFLARWGGEEFMIVMDAYDLEKTCHKIDEIRLLIEKSSLGVPEKITCSFGVTMLHPTDTFDEVVSRVDELLYLAKAQGRNRVVCRQK